MRFAAARARAGEDQTDADLAALMGEGPDRGLAIERPTLPVNKAFSLLKNLPAELLGRRPDVVAARFRVEAATKGIDRAEADFYPNINLMALVGFQSVGLNNLLLADSGLGSVGPAISLPIFGGGRLGAQYRGAEAEYAAAVAIYDGTLTEALREVDACVRKMMQLAANGDPKILPQFLEAYKTYSKSKRSLYQQDWFKALCRKS